MSRFTDLIDDLTRGARIVAWSEGVHLRQEYLQARNEAVRHLINRGVTVLAAETHFALAQDTDDHLRDPKEPLSAAAVHGVWSWAREPLQQNAVLLQLLGEHNRRVPDVDRVRFCGLDAFGYRSAGPAVGIDRVLDQLPHPDGSVAIRSGGRLAGALERWNYGQQDPAHHGVTSELLEGLDRLSRTVSDNDQRRIVDIYRRLARHQATGGDHRDIAVRDDLQYRNFIRSVDGCRPSDRILIFEQVEHLDPTVMGSLGSRLADDHLGPVVTIGALWSPEDPTISYPLGRYRPLADWLAHRTTTEAAGYSLVDLRPWRRSATERDHPAATAPFDAVLYASTSTPAIGWDGS